MGNRTDDITPSEQQSLIMGLVSTIHNTSKVQLDIAEKYRKSSLYGWVAVTLIVIMIMGTVCYGIYTVRSVLDEFEPFFEIEQTTTVEEEKEPDYTIQQDSNSGTINQGDIVLGGTINGKPKD